ncbi:MAG: hypothetical protein LBQ80_03900 [Clostridium sp.]|jgi:hypothetical protein|nr:hypothetical protein [Clostridium sp.]
MKKAVAVCIVLALCISAFTVGYAVALAPLSSSYRSYEPPDYSGVQTQINEASAVFLASARMTNAGQSTLKMKYTAYQSVGTQIYPAYYNYTPENLTWCITYYPPAWESENDMAPVDCLFAEVDGLAGKLLYAGKCTLTVRELREEIARNGKRLEAGVAITMEPLLIYDRTLLPNWYISEYFLGEGKVRVIKALPDDGSRDAKEYYTLTLKDEKVSDRLSFWTDSKEVEESYPGHIKYAVSGEEYICTDYEQGGTIWFLLKDGKTTENDPGTILDYRTLLP